VLDEGDGQRRLARVSTAEEVAAVLRASIMHGELGPDAPLREEALSERFEVSRRAVREALSLLQYDGLVTHHRYRGARVARLTADDIRDLYGVRRTLELAAADAARSAPADRKDALRAAFDELARATRSGDADQIVARDLEFHQAVVGLLDSARLDNFFRSIAVEMRYALSLLEASYRESQHRPRAALDEHRSICDALLGGDRRNAARLIAEHADVNERLLVDVVTGPDGS
jgi:DNA-binding GntR family transcriptional regulator